MRLDFKKLRTIEKSLGTLGTLGTANVYGPLGVPSALGSVGTPGTDESRGGSFVPTVPTHENAVGTETANVYEAVPTVPAVPAENSVAPSSLQDHTFWSDDLSKWALRECLFSDRGFGGIKVLHLHFCDWCAAQATVGCMLQTFEALLDSEGFLIAGGLVAGLVLKEAIDLARAESHQ